MKLVDGRLPWALRGVKVAVIGDLILDEYLDGKVHRISPEAPVPVHLVKGRNLTAGGAANVARNIQLAGGKAVLLGVVGRDEAGDSLKEILAQDQVDTSLVIVDSERPTIRKTSVTSNSQQMVRIDWEQASPISSEQERLFLERIKSLDCDIYLLSDYAKGCLTASFISNIIALAKEQNRGVIVDPKGHDYKKYQGATLLTPNRSEAMQALGLDNLSQVSGQKLARGLIDLVDLDSVVVTLGGDGMVGLSQGQDEAEDSIVLKANTREVFDVSGAGDTVVALLALCLGAGLKLDEAMGFANTAAGLVVEKWGTQPVYADELRTAVLYASEEGAKFSSTRKWVVLNQLKSLIGPFGQRKKSVVFTNGCFDILHAGHVSYLEAAKALGDILVVAVNSDASLKRLKGDTRPIIEEENRVKVLAGLGCIDYVLIFDEDTPQAVIKELAPDVLVKGADYEISEIVGAPSVLSRGGSVERIPFVDGLSTSEIIRRVQSLS